MEKNTKVAVLPTRKGLDTHTFVFRFEQHLPSHITKGGELVPEFHSELERTVTNINAITNENIACEAMEVLQIFIEKSKTEGKKSFKTGSPIIATFGINGRLEKSTTKVSISPNRIGTSVKKLAKIVSLIFRKDEPMHKKTFDKMLDLSSTSVMVMVDKIIKEDKKVKELAPTTEQITEPVIETV